MKKIIPNPGSEEAIKEGCKCPILDNNYGKGYYAGPEGSFAIVETCPLHGKQSFDEKFDFFASHLSDEFFVLPDMKKWIKKLLRKKI